MSLPDAVLVFGGSGFIGRNVVNELRGHVPLLIGVNTNGATVPGCQRCVALRDIASLEPLPNRTAIVNVASFRYIASRFASQQAEILAVNTALTEAVYRFALERGITEIRCASSSAVYPASWSVQDDTKPLDLNDWPHDGEAAYAWSKRWGEITAELWRRRAGVHTISFRLTNPYGPYDTLNQAEAHVATAFALRAIGDEAQFEIRGDPEAERDFVFSGDVAATFRASLELQGVDAAVNLAQGVTTRIADLALTAMQAAGTSRPLRTNPPPPLANAGIRIRRATAVRLRQLLPELPPFRSLESGLRSTIAWYKDALR